MSFTVFARARPIRVAFLLADAAGCDAVCDGLVKWSTEFWGGRRSVVVFTEKDGSLAKTSWQELVGFDPDYIFSFAPLSDDLLRKLNDEIAPCVIREPKRDPAVHKEKPESESKTADESLHSAPWAQVSVEVPGLAVPPTDQNLAFLRKLPLLLFEFSKDCPPLLWRFVHRNFGTYYQWFDLRNGEPRQLGWMENLLAKSSVEHLRVNDIHSLCTAIERISGKPLGLEGKPPLHCIAPSELSGIHLTRPFSRGGLNSTYRVVVGSGLRDFILYWRSCINEGDGVWDAPFRHCLWVPAEMIREQPFVAALKNWLYYFTGQGSSGNRSVELTSASLSPDDLSALVNIWGAGAFRVPARVTKAEDLESRWRDEGRKNNGPPRLISLLNGDNAERFVAVERTQTWELRPPPVIQPEVPIGAWMVDVQIEREQREGGLQGQDWWFLPRKSGLALVTSMFHAPARISRNGLFSVRVERNSPWPDVPTPPRLNLRLPADAEVLRGLLLNPHESWFEYSDARRERLKVKLVVTSMEISDAGRKLRGLIELFGGFWRARDYWGRTFWQEIFCRMAGRGAKYDTDFCTQTEGAIKKELVKLLPSMAGDVNEKAAHRIAGRVLGLVGERLPGVSMTFAEMEEERAQLAASFAGDQQGRGVAEVKYLAGDTVVHMLDVRPVTDDELKDGLKELVSLDALRMGMNLRCPRCRLQHWVGADGLHQSSSCPGCGSPTPLIPETMWSYRLNPLIRHCVNSRAFAVWLALAELAHRPDTFFFTPSAELSFAQPINGSVRNELDVLCVTDGELLLGEVKDGDVDRADFDKFSAIVQVLRPDRAAMFVSKDSNVDGWFKEFAKQLEPMGIRGELFRLPSY